MRGTAINSKASVSPKCAFSKRVFQRGRQNVRKFTVLRKALESPAHPREMPSEDNSSSSSSPSERVPYLRPLKIQEGLVDDPTICNPLQRMERLGTAWFGVTFEFEGVLVEDFSREHLKAWAMLAEKETLRPPLHWQGLKAAGMKAEQVIQEVFCWTRNPTEVRRLAQRKHEIFKEITGGRIPSELPGARKLLDTLRSQGTPLALVTTAPRPRVTEALAKHGLTEYFAAVITGEDSLRGRPDPEPLLLASMDIQRPPLRCIVVGNSNASVEAAHEIGMKCVAVATTHPLYELTAGDLVVRNLEDVSFVNLKSLFRYEEGRDSLETQMQEEEEDDTQGRRVQTMVLD